MSASPTLSVHATYAGVILGTAAYMSPEQARGKPVDRRTDIWSFGCVLFEMLTGKQAFDGGDTISDAVAAILRADPDWNALPADTPPHVRSILRRCLQKEPQKRLPHIAVVRLELDEPPAAGAPLVETAPTARRFSLATLGMVAVSGALVVGGIAAAVAWRLKPSSGWPTPVRFSIPLPEGQSFTATTGRPSVAISPDGTRIAYATNQRLYLRALADLEPHAIPAPSWALLRPIRCFRRTVRRSRFSVAGN